MRPMQTSSFGHRVFDTAANSPELQMIDLALGDLGAGTFRTSHVTSALAAPVAMLAGAVGLMGLWAVVPKEQSLPGPAPAIVVASATSLQSSAVAQAAELKDQAVDQLLVDLGAPVALVRPPVAQMTATAAQTVAGLRDAEMNMVSAADLDAQARLQAMQASFRESGLDARAYMAPLANEAPAVHAPVSPLELRDVRVLAARLDLDPDLARGLQQTARRLTAAHTLAEAEAAMPLSNPVDDPVRSSPFGTRIDPFTGAAAFHPGQDFSGHYGQPIHVTAPGVVSFVGQRSGYGNVIEVDHGYGFKTRYGHLQAFDVGVGRQVKTGDVIGRMGSTGRSTGVHLHYEVWASGRLLDPARFLRFPEGVSQPG